MADRPQYRLNRLNRLSRRAGVLAALLGVFLALPCAAQAATIAVTTTDDEINGDGDCSVREAVQSVNATVLEDACLNTGAGFGTADTVTLAAGAVYQLTLTGDGEQLNATGDLDVLKDLTINGNAATPPAFIGNVSDGDRILEVPSTTSASLTLNSLNLNGGEVTDSGDEPIGGNIRYRGSETLTLDDVLVELGAAGNTGGGMGGGIAADSGAVVIQNGSEIKNNDAGPTTGSSFFGGGIHIGGAGTDLTITESSVSGNDAGVGGGATFAMGGGIHLDATGTSIVTLTNATISNNNAGGTGVGGNGGGIATGFGATPDLTITGGSIANNDAGGGPGAGGLGAGGGIFSDGTGTGGPISLSSVDVTGNRAGGAGGDNDGIGGGISSDASLQVQDGSIVSGNKAGIDDDADDLIDPAGTGGGIRVSEGALLISDSTVNLNRAGEEGGAGGGIQLDGPGNLSITGSSITNNATGTGFAAQPAIGGGLNRGNISGSPVDSVTDSTVSGNSARGGGGGDDTRGGGIAVVTRGTFALTRSTVSTNTVTGNSGDSFGGGLSLESASAAAAFTLENSTVSANNATSNDSGNGGNGGGLSVGILGGTAETLAITQSTLAGNVAEDQPGPPGKGGNLRVVNGLSGSVDLRGSIVSAGTGESGAENCSAVVTGTIDSLGGSVEGPATSQCGLDQTSDRPSADPLLGALGSNGGPTQTRAITSAASPAVDLVPAGLCPAPATDQRGTVRPAGGACDAGAFESPFSLGSTPPPQVQPPASTPKKCKKGQKLKKGKCVKKKRKKK